MTEIVTVTPETQVTVDTPLDPRGVWRGGRNHCVSSVFPAISKAGDRGVEPRVAVLETGTLRCSSLQRHAVKSACDRQCDRHGRVAAVLEVREAVNRRAGHPIAFPADRYAWAAMTAEHRRLLRELMRGVVSGPPSPSKVEMLRRAWGADRRRP